MKPGIYYLMSLYLGIFLAASSYFAGNWNYFINGVLIAAIYAFFDLLWTYFRDRVFYLPVASVISGFIIALVGPPEPSWKLIFLLPLGAVVLKQMVKVGERRHIFNPAAATLVFLGLGSIDNLVSWWAPAFADGILFWLMLGAGIYILYQMRRWGMVLSFIISYALLLLGLFLFQGREFVQIPSLLYSQIADGTVIFFVTVMLIEHVTSNFPGRKNRIIFGALVAFISMIFTIFGSYLLGPDPFLAGLLFANLIMSVVTLLL